MSADSTSIRVLVVEDHPIFREAVAGLLVDQADMTLVGQAADGREAIEQFRIHRPDVTLMDIQMPELDGVDATIAIRDEFPQARIIVLTTYADDVRTLRALKAGAQAYLLKNLLHKELVETIRAVHSGNRIASP
jgi:DNA-binding NarL/FixJ family response regulator